MAFHDPVERRVLQFAERRYRARCDNDERMLERADSMREVSRIANQALPGDLYNSEAALDIRRHLVRAAEERAHAIIHEQLSAWIKAEPEFREKLRHQLEADWQNLTGVLAPLRISANNRFHAVQQGEAMGEG